MGHTRISITLPPDVLAAADRRAGDLERSRSWLIVEAIRAYLAAPAQVRAPATPYAAGLGAQRLAQLKSDLRLSPEARVRAAEETARLSEVVREPARPAARVLSFSSYEHYLDWKRKEHAG